MSKNKSSLRIIRIVLATVSILIMTLLFASRAGYGLCSFLTKAQFIPALLSANIIVLAALLAVTFLFGRIYCSVICPLGITQDFINWLVKKTGGKKKSMRFGYSRPKNILRYTILAIYVIAVILGVGSFMALLDPYAAFGRIMTHMFVPVSVWINNLIANATDWFIIEKYVGINSLALSVAIVTFVVVAYMAARGGRSYCNTLCPVGSFLGLVSRHSLLKVRIDESKCVGCGLCGKKCRASCIDMQNHAIDYSRCVDCFDCIGNCSRGAIKYTAKNINDNMRDKSGAEDESRRKFLSVLAMAGMASTRIWAKDKVEKIESVVEDKPVTSHTPVSPFGSISHKHLNSKCTACHLCIDKCPTKVLRPAINEYGLDGIMQPVLDFTKGFCDYDCTRCGDVCPTDAIKSLTPDQKQATHVGYAVFIKENCVNSKESLLCGICSRSCLAYAIKLKPNYNEPLTEEEIRVIDALPDKVDRPRAHYRVYPEIDRDLCIGCGTCQNRCPGKAIVIEGYKEHR